MQSLVKTDTVILESIVKNVKVYKQTNNCASIIGTKAIANENIFLIYIIRHHLASSEEENSMQKSFEACIKLVWMEVSGDQENFLRQSNGVGESYSCKGNPRRQQV